MGNLQNKRIKDSYGGLLHTTEDTGLSGTTKSVIQDGNGVDTSLELSTDKVNVNGDLQTGGVDRITSTGELTNVSGNISQFTNDEGFISSIPPTYLESGDNISELTNDSGYLTSIPTNVMVEGENVSLLNNDAGYLTFIPSTYLQSGDNISELTNDSGYLTNIPSNVMVEGENVSLLNNDSGYLTDGTLPSDVMREGENISLLNNDSGYITGINDGVIQTENGGELGLNKTFYTDSQGNKTGQFSWKQYGLNGVANTDNLGQSPQWLISNDNWNTSSWPQSTGAVSFGFTDFDQYFTYSIQQNRFGGTTYKTWAPSQPHIFTGANGNDGVIRMNTFSSLNNSDNWYEAYNSNISNVSVDESNNLILETRSGAQLSTALPSGSGGGGDKYDHQVGWTAGIGLNNSTSQNISYSSYQAYLNDVYFQPIYLSANNTYTKFKYYVNAADTDPSNFLSIGIYDSQIQTASTLFAGIGLPTNRLVVNNAVPINVNGYVEVDFPEPFTPAESGLYWLGHIVESPTSTTLALRTFDAKTMSHSSVFPSSVINENIDKENGSIYNFYSTPQYPVVNESSTDAIRLNNYSELVQTITYPTTIGASLVGGAGIAIYTNS